MNSGVYLVEGHFFWSDNQRPDVQTLPIVPHALLTPWVKNQAPQRSTFSTITSPHLPPRAWEKAGLRPSHAGAGSNELLFI